MANRCVHGKTAILRCQECHEVARARITELEEKAAELMVDADLFRGKIGQLESSLYSCQDHIYLATKENKALRAQLDRADTKVAELEGEREAASSSMGTVYRDMERQRRNIVELQARVAELEADESKEGGA